MEEINARPFNGYSMVSTFSGGGGSCTGFRMAGFRTLWANEFVEAARQTYAANYPQTPLCSKDIRDVTGQEVLDTIGLKAGELDVLEGSPPCSSFSTAGKRNQHWGDTTAYSDTNQRTDDLFFELVRLVKDIQPKVFIAENVSGLVKGVSKGYFLEILRAFKKLGYTVEAKLLDAQWLGVPQARQRIFFMGVRSDLDLAPAFPTPLSYRYSVRDALPWITRQGDNGAYGTDRLRDAIVPSGTIGASPHTGNGRASPAVVESVLAIEGANGFNGHAYQSTDQPAATVPLGRSLNVRVGTFSGDYSIEEPAPTVLTHGRLSTRSDNSLLVEPESSMDGYAVGKAYDDLRPGEQSKQYYQLVRAGLDQPSPTVTQRGGDRTVASVAHPTERRKFSIAELKRICSFPDDYVLTGTYAQQWERCGRSVPPVMAAAVATAIREGILDRLPR